MRDIKFRAWDKISKTMCDVVEIHQSWIAIPFAGKDGEPVFPTCKMRIVGESK